MRLVIDTETTGLPNAVWARVVEVAAVLIDANGAEVGTFSSLMCPDILDDRADRALSYCGITRQEVAEAPPFSRVRTDFFDWIREVHPQEVWAYNRVFDETMLARSGFELAWTGCVMRLARTRMPHRSKDPSLREAALHFVGQEPLTSHRALADARAAAQVLAVLTRP